MSEDSNFVSKKKPQMNADERRCGLDFFGTLGKGMLPKENLETPGYSSGLTPLGFGFNVRNRIMDRNTAGFSTTEFTENTEEIRNSSGLTPLHFVNEPQMNADKRRCGCIDIENNHERTITQGCLSGLSVRSESPWRISKKRRNLND
ncbi:MAG: hypothetical protein PHH85_02895 [Candidatus Methanoperedens sp.]|nr:hypothetical protein [Candidatus Methanoperedens sp.]